MTEFPVWARDWLEKYPQKVSHGLNLALKLKRPELMPLVLWDIVVARPSIQRALDGLSFVHFARFVPSWDGKALMVITEFDGPLEPYVMDFAIAIGDVFDRLLSYTEDAPPLPVREHPEAFWRFVQEWNRVPFFPWGGQRPDPQDPNSPFFPPDFDDPVYSAYPERSAIDIAGPHKKRPPPALDRPAAVVDLHDVQGNILRPYAAATARHLFLRVTDAAKARVWLALQAAPATPARTEPWPPVTDASPWPRDAQGRVHKPALMLNVAFTFAGLQALLPGRHQDLGRFPEAFRQGALARAGDIGDKKSSGPDAWLIGKPGQVVHVVLSLHTFASEALGGTAWQQFTAAFTALLAQAMASGLAVEATHEAQAFLDADGKPTGEIYFGYQDGIAQPRIAGQCPLQGGARPDFQPAASPGEFLLGAAYADIFGGPSLGPLAEDLAHNGSFAALRLLEQDVQAFEQMLASQSAAAGVSPAELQARLMGRWAQGEPLTLSQTPPPAGPAALRNDFDYAPSWEHPQANQDHAGRLCPVGAHIRRVNPRSARVAGQPHTRRLIRRGMPTHWQEDGTTRKGLLGLFICGSLERQFEFIQREWIQGDFAASGIRGTQDPIAGLREQETEFRFMAGGQAGQPRSIQVPSLVTTRGSLYLFMPGLKTLRSLDALNVAPVPAPRPEAASRDADKQALRDVTRVPEDLLRNIDTALPGALLMLLLAGFQRGLDFLRDAKDSLKAVQAVARWPAHDFAALADFHVGVEKAFRITAVTLGLEDRLRRLLSDLVLRGVQSEAFKELVETFSPPPRDPASQTPIAGVPRTPLDPADPAFIVDPYTPWQTLRNPATPFVWSEAHGAYWVLNRADAQAVLAQQGSFLQQPAGVALRGIITLDPPRHTVVRKAVADALAVAAAEERVDGFLNTAVKDALKAIGPLQQFDAVPLFTNAVPAQVYWEVFGLPDEHREECAALARKTMLHFGQPASRGLGDEVVSADATVRLVTRLALLLTEALWAGVLEPLPGPNPVPNRFKGTLIGELADRIELLRWPGGQRTISFMEALLTLLQLVLAGFMSMQFLMGTALRNLLLPDPRSSSGGAQPWAALGALRESDPPLFNSKLALALDEARRFDPPVTIVQRFAGPHGAELRGVKLPKDSAVFVIAGSANRDSAAVPHAPDQFHWDRPAAAGHLSLGHGIHLCVGLELQNLIVPQALTALLTAMPQLQLVDAQATPAWLDNVYFRALQSLPVQRC